MPPMPQNASADCTFDFYDGVITGYSGDLPENLVIPSSIDGKTVTGIGDSAFSDCESMTSVSIPASVNNIGQDAFYNCTSLASVSISSGVTKMSIGWMAFADCPSLSNRLASIRLDCFRDTLDEVHFVLIQELFEWRHLQNGLSRVFRQSHAKGCKPQQAGKMWH